MKVLQVQQALMPTSCNYLEKVFVDMDPDNEVEDPYKRKNEELFTWRFIRSMSNSDLTNFMAADSKQVQPSATSVRASLSAL